MRDQVSHPYKRRGKIIVYRLHFYMGDGKIRDSEMNAWKQSQNLICSEFLLEYTHNFDLLL
jgi:hypothetical protein